MGDCLGNPYLDLPCLGVREQSNAVLAVRALFTEVRD